MMFLFTILLLVAAYYLFKEDFKPAKKGITNSDPLATIKHRYAKGEIDEETYFKMVEVINK